jgi:uncharacterized membrane protein
MNTIQAILLYSMAAFYMFAGFNHFKNSRFYESIMPSFFTHKIFWHKLSGLAEILLALGLLFDSTRLWSSYLIIAMLVVFFIVHISHLIDPPKMAKGKTWFLWVRIPFQFLFIYWAYIVGKY